MEDRDKQNVPELVRQELSAYPNVTGTAYGLKEPDSDEQAVIVFVREKLPESELADDDVIPATVEVDGERVATDVKVSGVLQFESEPVSPTGRDRRGESSVTEWTTERIRPAVGGVSLGHVSLGGSGTMGTSPLRTTDGKVAVLTNSHVAGLNGDASPGDAVLQPDPGDGGRAPDDVIGTLLECSTVSATDVNTTDSALVEVDTDDVADAILCFDGELRGWTEPTLGATYSKCGRSSGLTRGRLIARDGEFTIRQSDGTSSSFRGVDVYERMTLPGDSGSLYVDERSDGLHGTSLHFAGGGEISLGVPMTAVQAEHGTLTPVAATGSEPEPSKPAKSGRPEPRPAPDDGVDGPVQFDVTFAEVAGSSVVPERDGAATVGEFTSHRFVDDEGDELDYLKYVPSGIEDADSVPLLVFLHGCNQTPRSFAAETRGNVLAEQETCVAVYPDQSGAANPAECWTWYDDAHTTRGRGEAALVAGLTRQVVIEHDVNSDRVYVAGLSAGGAMASNVAVAYPDLFAALCVHSGLEYDAADSMFEALQAMRQGGPDPQAKGEAAFEAMGEHSRTLPTIVFHGTNDFIVSPVNAEQVVEQTTQMNDLADTGADDDSVDHVADRTVPGHASGRRFVRSEYHDGDGDPLVVRYLVEGMGHAWSGGAEDGQFTDPNGPDATGLMWDFFDSHTLETGPVADATSVVTTTEQPITFYGGGSYDVDGSITDFKWDFGDGQAGTGETVTHSYRLPGEYTVRLAVTDEDGNRATDERAVRIERG